MTASTVATPTASYARQANRWRMLDDLCGGTEAMIRASTLWLPKEEAEHANLYTNRLNRSILYPAFADTIDTGVARMLSKPIALTPEGALSERLAEIEHDADRSGTSLTQTARQWARDGMKYGRLHFLVEFPNTDATTNLKTEQESGVRPYFATVCPTDIIGWKFRRGADGRQILAQVRIRETRTEPDGEYAEKEVKSVRVLTDDGEGPARWQVWTEGASGEYAVTEEGTYTIGYIPLVTAYYDYVAPFEANPPYEGLAWQNIKHWRSSSEQDNLLRVARVPILTGAGIPREEIEAGIKIGASKILASPSPDAKWAYVEHSGAAIGAGQKDIEEIEKRMEALGMAPMTTRSGAVTATAKAIDESKSGSDLEAWARVTEAAIREGYEIAAEWINEKLPEDFGVDISTQSDMLLVGDGDLQTLDAARARRDISRLTYLGVLKVKRILPKDLDVDAESAAAEKESADMAESLGAMTGFGRAGNDESALEADAEDAA